MRILSYRPLRSLIRRLRNCASGLCCFASTFARSAAFSAGGPIRHLLKRLLRFSPLSRSQRLGLLYQFPRKNVERRGFTRRSHLTTSQGYQTECTAPVCSQYCDFRDTPNDYQNNTHFRRSLRFQIRESRNGALSSRAGNITTAQTRARAPCTAIPTSRNGNSNSHTIG